ncbi:SDR family NAD(P)-dependent oxidoreductase [Ciceribacter thiooxidans]|uniref:SDR family NAD(P)-dependent oxidoreductase n=1 Tax=Ciceribacter thiooxidans TaxID=1969821 RepID=A0ABV7I1W8_9HYPH|nr:SDR family oxidoreductase [Ciceribacter thiooxidans]
MLLSNKNIVIFGGSGAIGSAVAAACLAEGARVFIGARDAQRLAAAASLLDPGQGTLETFVVDTQRSDVVTRSVARIAAEVDEIDVVMDATSVPHDQGSQIDALDLGTFMEPVDGVLASLFNTTKAALPYMGKARQGLVLTLTTPGGRTAVPGHLGNSVASAGVEAFTRVLAAELGPRNIRAVCLGPHALADAPKAGSYTAKLFAPKAAAMGMTVEEWLGAAAGTTMLGRLPTLKDVAETAVFLMSDRSRAMTAAYVNLTSGMIAD